MALFHHKNEQLERPNLGAPGLGQRCFRAQRKREVLHGDEATSRGTGHPLEPSSVALGRRVFFTAYRLHSEMARSHLSPHPQTIHRQDQN